MKHNLILNSDSYKCSHWKFYPEGTTEVYSYLESRGGKYPKTLFFGLQGLLKEYLFTPLKLEDVQYAADFAKEHGTLVENSNVLMTVQNTDPALPWVTSYIETLMLRLWYPITVATRIYYMKQKIKPYFDKTSDSGFMDFALLDFSARGNTSYESSMIGGGAYLLSFSGTDTMAAVDYVSQLYGGKILGFSIPATEHSVMTAYGLENELASFERIIDLTEEGTTVSVVSDSWNIFDAVEKWSSIAEKIKAKNITLVVRPDSGDVRLVMGEVLRNLKRGFSSTTNSKGFEVLNNVKVLWGDGINEDTVTIPFEVAYDNKISADSVLTGSGGGLMQVDINRDTNKFAFKASNMIINGVSTPIAKDPITDFGKRSKKGKLKLAHYNSKDEGSGYITLTESMTGYEIAQDELQTVYFNGQLIYNESMETIRKRIK
jgi:nicotinamide phosphoribosyltransferase